MGIKACYVSGEQDDERMSKDVIKGAYQIVFWQVEDGEKCS